MPIYEYSCTECGAHIEKRQSISDEPLRVCEECGGKLEKKWSLSGFQFKGEGWYVTDYSKKSHDGGKKESKEKTAGTESTEKAETASKPKSDATKTPDKSSGPDKT